MFPLRKLSNAPFLLKACLCLAVCSFLYINVYTPAQLHTRYATHHSIPTIAQVPSRISNSSSPTPDRNKPYNFSLYLQTPVVYEHNFKYIFKPDVDCSKVELVIISPSAPANFFRRSKVRTSDRMKFVRNETNQAVHMFFLGATTNRKTQKKIEQEVKKFGDIVQEDFIDVYKNITLKATSMLKWISEFCAQPHYVLRLDDDVEGDITLMIKAMGETRKETPNFILGDVKVGWGPCAIPKCLTTKKEYPHATLPPFALGGALGYSTSAVKRLYQAALRVKRFKLDDVYITAMCASVVNVTLKKHKDFVFKHHAW